MQRRTTYNTTINALWTGNADHGAAMTLRHKGGLHHSECTLLMLNVYNKWGGVNSSILLALSETCLVVSPNTEESI